VQLMAMLLRASRAVRAAPRTTMRSGAMRRMCTVAAEEAAEVGPFSPTIPHNQMFYATAAVMYAFVLKWQAGDRKLAAEIAEHKAAHAPAEAEVVAEVVSTPSAPTPSPVVAAVTAAAPVGATVADWKVGDVVAWLDTIELGEHGASFKTHSVNGKMLLALSDQDLYTSLNVVSPLHRKKLLMEVAGLRKAYLNP